jgi:hypothetical protein
MEQYSYEQEDVRGQNVGETEQKRDRERKGIILIIMF